MISGATRPKSYHLQLKFPFNYCISRCRCPNNANVGSKIQGISFFVNKSIWRLDDRSFFNRHSCLLRASEWCFRKTPKVKSWLKNYNWKFLFVIVYPNANVQKCKCCVFSKFTQQLPGYIWLGHTEYYCNDHVAVVRTFCYYDNMWLLLTY